MNFTGIDFTIVPDNSSAYIAFDLEYGFRLLEERRDINAVYFRDLADPDADGVSNTALTTQGLIIKSSLVSYNGALGPLESKAGTLIKIGDTWSTVLLYNSNKDVIIDNYPTKLPPIQSIENNLINVPLHGLANNTPIQFSGTTPPIGITEGVTYYVRNPTTNSFNISATSGGSNITLTDRPGELHVSRLYSVFTPTLDYDVIKDTIIGKVIRTGSLYTVETFYNVSGESITSFELVEALPAFGDYEGQVVLYENTFFTWNGVSWATSSGASSRTVSLSVTQQAFDYTSNGNKVGTPTSTVTATAFGTTGTLSYVFKLDGSVVTGSGNTYTYTPSPTFVTMPDIVTVDLYEDGLLVASDLITMFGVIEGGDAITVILSNEAHTVPTNSSGGSPDFTGSGTTVKVFRGNTPLNFVAGGTTSSFDISVSNGPTVSGSTSVTGTGTATATIGDLTGISAATGFRNITITVYFDGATTTFSKIQSFSRSLAGIDGAGSQTVTVTGEQAFKFLAGQSVPVSTSITLTAVLAGGLTLFDWEYWNGSSWVNLSGTQNAATYSLAYDNAAFTGESIRIRCLSGSFFDEITVVKLRDGATGVNAISAYLTNETHTVSAASDGTGYSLATAGGNFVVFNGTTDATGTAVLSIVGGSGTTTLTKVQNGLTLTLTEATGVYTLSGASWTTDSETFTLRAVLSGVTVDKVYTISKSKAGVAGGPGGTGPTGSSARTIYTKLAVGVNWNTDTTARTASATGSTGLPDPTTESNPWWGQTATWSNTVVTLNTNEILYQVNGIYNPVTNTTTWYGPPYLSSLKVGQLDAISATIGILRTATTGARTEIKDNLIEVYDASNQLRVRLGIWT